MKLRVGDKLLAIRTNRMLSQDDFSEILGMSKSAYARLEKKETSIELENLINIAKTLEVPIYELLPDTLAMNNNSTGNGSINFGTINNYNIHAPLSEDSLETIVTLVAQRLKNEKPG